MTSGAPFFWELAERAAYQVPVLLVCLFAWSRGGPPERYGAFIYTLSVVASVAVQAAVGLEFPAAQVLGTDFAVAVGFLVLAVRYNSLWLGMAMMLKGVQLALHAIHLTDGSDLWIAGFNLYAVALNLITLALLGVFVAATLSHQRRLHARRQDMAPSGAGAPAS